MTNESSVLPRRDDWEQTGTETRGGGWSGEWLTAWHIASKYGDVVVCMY